VREAIALRAHLRDCFAFKRVKKADVTSPVKPEARAGVRG
jgi:hypothetical protein